MLIDKIEVESDLIEGYFEGRSPISIDELLERFHSRIQKGADDDEIDYRKRDIDGLYKRVEKRAAGLEIEVAALKEVAFSDALTGMPNRRYLNMYLNFVLDKVQNETQRPVAIIALDLDHFKWVNDIYGHDVGDEVLKKMKEMFPDELRSYDHVFLDKKNKRFNVDKSTKLNGQMVREGGEEFYIVLPNTSYDEALAVANRLRADIEKGFNGFFDQYSPLKERDTNANMPETLTGLTASIGVSSSDAYVKSRGKDILIGYDKERLKQNADRGAYLAKKLGRNSVETVCFNHK